MTPVSADCTFALQKFHTTKNRFAQALQYLPEVLPRRNGANTGLSSGRHRFDPGRHGAVHYLNTMGCANAVPWYSTGQAHFDSRLPGRFSFRNRSPGGADSFLRSMGRDRFPCEWLQRA